MCELTDEDGDKWWLEYRGNAEGTGGTYTAAGRASTTAWSVAASIASTPGATASKDVAFLGCYPNKGTYKLK